jgi:hypothetical protein
MGRQLWPPAETHSAGHRPGATLASTAKINERSNSASPAETITINGEFDIPAAGPHVGPFESGVVDVGPQVGYTPATGNPAARKLLWPNCLDWRFAPKWDVYAGFMFSQVSGGLFNGYLRRNNVDPSAGLRFRF